MYDSKYPLEPTFYIAYGDNKEYLNYGIFLPNQQFTTGLKTAEVFTDKDAWLARLESHGIKPDAIPVENDLKARIFQTVDETLSKYKELNPTKVKN